MRVLAAVLVAIAGTVLATAPAASAADKPNLHLAIARNGPSVVPLRAHMYTTLFVQNFGPADADQIVLWIRVPNQLSIRSPNAHAEIGGCYPRGHDWKCELGGLEPDNTIEVEMDARAIKKGSGLLRFEVSSHQKDAHPVDNRKAIHVRVGGGPARADLSISAEPAGTLQAGVPSLFRFRVNNNGPSAADHVSLRIEVTSDGRLLGGQANCLSTGEDQKIAVCTVDFLNAKASAQFDIQCYLPLGDAHFAMKTGSKTTDPVKANNQSTLTVAVGPPARTADLGVGVDVPTHAHVGEATTVKALVTNHGPDEAHAVHVSFIVLSDDTTEPVELVSLSSPRGPCGGAGCLVGTMRSGETLTMTLVLIFHGPGTFTIGAFAAGSDDAYDPGLFDSLPPEQRDSWNGYAEHTIVEGQASSFSRNRSLTTFGSALPPVSFITCPTKNPSRPCLPPR